jgi:hypothetical protein
MIVGTQTNMITESSGPTDLLISTIADGEFLRRVGTMIVGATPSGGMPAGTGNEVQYRADATTFGPAPLRFVDDVTMAQYNGTYAQIHEWYRTRTNATNWERVQLHTAPAAGWSQLRLQSSGTGAANISLALTPLGNGALSAQVPDNTTAGGNARGQFATDWQRQRNAATQVASGQNSVIAGGQHNTASATCATIAGGTSGVASGGYSTIGGGYFNSATATYATVSGGASNDATSTYSTIGGGNSNSASGQYSTVGGGDGNTASGQYSTVGGGNSNSASGQHSTVGGGHSNTASGLFSWVPGGRYGSTRGLYGAYAWSGNRRSVDGDAQRLCQPVQRVTSDATPTVLTADRGAPSTTNILVLPNNSAWSGIVQVVARDTNGNVAKWTFDVLAKRGANAASTTIVDAHLIRTVADTALLTAAVAIVADTTRGAATVQVTGVAGTTIDWWAEFFGGQVAR